MQERRNHGSPYLLWSRWLAFIGPLALCAVAVLALRAVAVLADEAPNPATVIRILAPPGAVMQGRTDIETLVNDPGIRRVVFFVDGEQVARRKTPPWNAKVELGKPAREQTLEVRAYGADDHELGRDQVVINQRPRPLRARITSLKATPLSNGDASSVLDIEADVSLPLGATLDRLDLYFNQTHLKRIEEPPFIARVEVSPSGSGDFLRAVAVLKDGRSHEDVELLNAPGLTDEVDVNLVQIQVLVTQKSGAPVTDLGLENFEVLQGGQPREIESFQLASDVPLVLGMVIDSSGSMRQAWSQTLRTAKNFLRQVMERRDRSFLVDFNERLTLAQPLTAKPANLYAALDLLVPDGGTALYDSILYSLFQFQSEPGRRALVVLTDGFDSASTTDEQNAVHYARKLGVPVYVIALPGQGPQMSADVHALKLVTDPTGGRLLRVGSRGGLERAFGQISNELRHQYVLTFYTETLPDDKREKVTVSVRGRKNVEVRAVFAWDQMG